MGPAHLVRCSARPARLSVEMMRKPGIWPRSHSTIPEFDAMYVCVHRTLKHLSLTPLLFRDTSLWSLLGWLDAPVLHPGDLAYRTCKPGSLIHPYFSFNRYPTYPDSLRLVHETATTLHKDTTSSTSRKEIQSSSVPVSVTPNLECHLRAQPLPDTCALMLPLSGSME